MCVAKCTDRSATALYRTVRIDTIYFARSTGYLCVCKLYFKFMCNVFTGSALSMHGAHVVMTHSVVVVALEVVGVVAVVVAGAAGETSKLLILIFLLETEHVFVSCQCNLVGESIILLGMYWWIHFHCGCVQIIQTQIEL